MENKTITRPNISSDKLWENMAPESRVWIYQANRVLSDQEAVSVTNQLNEFTQQWASHSIDLVAKGALLFNTFIVLMVDQSRHGASGCSIDSSVHFIQNLADRLSVDFMDRMIFAIYQDNSVSLLNRQAFAQAYEKGIINNETVVFDNLVNTKADFLSSWTKKLENSWHKRMV